jgi:hypothetical protein
MTKIQVTRGTTTGPRDRLVARAQRRLPTDELTRVRAMALAWRNGLGALLAGLIGFGLVKGRTDVGSLASPYGVVVGVLLVLALLAGGIAAILVLRAAHGRPAGASMAAVAARPSDDPEGDAEQVEAGVSARALENGVRLAFVCVTLLVAAVAVTWYGPAKSKPQIAVVTSGSTWCGDVVKLSGGILTLKTDTGQTDVRLGEAVGLRAVAACPQAK